MHDLVNLGQGKVPLAVVEVEDRQVVRAGALLLLANHIRQLSAALKALNQDLALELAPWPQQANCFPCTASNKIKPSPDQRKDLEL